MIYIYIYVRFNGDLNGNIMEYMGREWIFSWIISCIILLVCQMGIAFPLMVICASLPWKIAMVEDFEVQ